MAHNIQKLRALLVAIDQYHPDSRQTTNLSGCVNDIYAVAELLKTLYGYLNPEIVSLINEKATRYNLIETFRGHLRDQADENTTTLFYFSGHGSIQAANPLFEKYASAKNIEETLVCYDSRVGQGLDLADKELGILLEELMYTQAHIVVILDCCHSGSGTRGANHSKWTARKLPPRRLSDNHEQTLLKDYFLKTEAQEGVYTLPMSRHVLLTACQNDQNAHEIQIGDQVRGIFSSYLEKVLKEYQGKITYANLFSSIQEHILQHPVQKAFYSQEPHFEGYNDFNAHTYFLDGTCEKSKRYQVVFQNPNWFIELGTIHGLSDEEEQVALFSIYEQPYSTKAIAQAHTTQVSLSKSKVQIIPYQAITKHEYWAEVISLPLPLLPVYLKGDSSNCDSLKTLPNKYNLSYAFFTQEEKAQIKLNVLSNGYQIYDKRHLICEDKNHFNLREIVYSLEKIAKWKLLLNKNNPDTHLNSDQVKFDIELDNSTREIYNLRRKQTRCDEMLASYFEIYTKNHNNQPESKQNIPYIIKAQNKSKKGLYFTLIHFKNNYGIKVLKQEKMPPESKEIILTDDFSLPAAKQGNALNYFRLVVSTQPIKPYIFEQTGLSTKALRVSFKKNTQILSDWFIKTILVKQIHTH